MLRSDWWGATPHGPTAYSCTRDRAPSRQLGAVSLLLASLIGVLLCGCGEAEPPPDADYDHDAELAEITCGGVHLSAWIAELDTPLVRDGAEVRSQSMGADDALGLHPAVSALVRIGADAVPCLVEILKTGTDRARGNAAKALGRIRPPATRALPALIELAKLTESPASYDAVLALPGAGPSSPEVLGFLASRLRQGPPECRLVVVRSLGTLGPRAVSVMPELEKILSEWIAAGHPRRDTSVALEAATSLGRMGPAAAGSIGLLREAFLAAPYGKLGVALADTQTPQARQVLLEALQHPDPGVRHAGLAGLQVLREPAVEAVSVLDVMLSDPHVPRIRWNAAIVLGTCGAHAGSAVPSLLRALGHEDHVTRVYAARALAKIGRASGGVMSALEAARTDPNEWVRAEAESALDDLKSRRTPPR